jgi:hypothetical protein
VTGKKIDDMYFHAARDGADNTRMHLPELHCCGTSSLRALPERFDV